MFTDALPPDQVQFHAVITHDADDQAAALAGWQQRYQQLSPGPFVGELVQGAVGSDLQFFHEKTNRRLSEVVVAPAEHHTFALVRSASGDIRVDDWRTPGQCLLSNPAMTPLDLELPEDTVVDCLTVTTAELRQYAEAIIGDGGDQVRLFERALFRSPVLADLVRDFCLKLRSACASPATLALHSQSQRALRSAAISNLILALDVEGPVPEGHQVMARHRYRVVQLARERLEVDVPEVCTVADLCRAIGVSRRTLQYCFEDVLQLNPIAYIRAMRLNAVRRELRRADPKATTVADVAARFGFWHLSHFSADYKRMFGELPSATLTSASPPSILVAGQAAAPPIPGADPAAGPTATGS